MDLEIFVESLSDFERKSLFSILYRNIGKQSIKDFIDENNCSRRLKNVLRANRYYEDENGSVKMGEKIFKYVEDVTEPRFRKIRNAGDKTWNEFKSYLKQ